MIPESRSKIPVEVALGLAEPVPAEAPEEAPEELRLVVNLDNLTIGDLETMDRASDGELPMSDLIEVMDRCVDGDVRVLPLLAMKDILDAITAGIKGLSNPVVDGKN